MSDIIDDDVFGDDVASATSSTASEHSDSCVIAETQHSNPSSSVHHGATAVPASLVSDDSVTSLSGVRTSSSTLSCEERDELRDSVSDDVFVAGAFPRTPRKRTFLHRYIGLCTCPTPSCVHVVASTIIRGVVKIFSASCRCRVDTLLRPIIFLHMISLIKNALWPATLHALYNQIIGDVWRHPKIALCGTPAANDRLYLGPPMRFFKSRGI